MCKNLQAAKELIETYRSISIETLEELYEWFGSHGIGAYIMEDLTGFGCRQTCPLCQGVTCNECIWFQNANGDYVSSPCTKHITFSQIQYANNPKSLKAALLARADILEELYENSRK